MRNKRQIIVTQEDHDRLQNLLTGRLAAAISDQAYLRALQVELDNARVVRPEEIPPNVVTMYSTVQLRELRTRDLETYTLVYPTEADIASGKLSVLAPIGTAILGYRVSDRIQWTVPSGTIRFRIEALVFQPEREAACS